MFKNKFALGLALVFISGLALLTNISKVQAYQMEGHDLTLRVADYNIAAGAPMKINTVAQAQAIAAKDIDVIGLSEVDQYTKRHNYDMLNRFTQFAKMPYASFGKTLDFQGGKYGTGIASKIPLTDVSQVTYPNQENLGQTEDYIYQRTVLNVKGVKIAFYNTHMAYENAQIRTAEINKLKDAILKDPIPYKIVVGDFNTDQTYQEWAPLADMMNFANGKDGHWTDTFNTYDKTMKLYAIDNILTSKNIEINHFEVPLWPWLSDHYPVIAEVTLKNVIDTQN
ncbi:endonuclease/exonuclease/phosphatase family protein [Agrilactobacillus fermenti]|uniref:endonuclease/exonuclease/phosphatase family protein n=1 Tax=Agrilactobacillus fermenti TaxID=2586909 RepID=UPI001E5CAAF3|nr:endonuclease/exonuclease/phosphatase family protein [Agrilactobacillus fermenti]MCD2255612.1 endonuclease/exonuclease/phosphatase family protein [Agrilactobacillus fermenti]